MLNVVFRKVVSVSIASFFFSKTIFFQTLPLRFTHSSSPTDTDVCLIALILNSFLFFYQVYNQWRFRFM